MSVRNVSVGACKLEVVASSWQVLYSSFRFVFTFKFKTNLKFRLMLKFKFNFMFMFMFMFMFIFGMSQASMRCKSGSHCIRRPS